MGKRTEILPCELTDDELITKGQLLAHELQKKMETEAEKKAAADRFKERLEDHIREIDKLGQQIGSRTEHREVEVFEAKSYDEGLMETFRKDTGERIRARPLKDDEYQQEFGLDPVEDRK